jgi:hypothetical protein
MDMGRTSFTASTGKNAREVRSGDHLENVESRKLTTFSQTITQATADSRTLSPHCGYVVVLYHVGNQQLVCLHVTGTLPKTPRYHSR